MPRFLEAILAGTVAILALGVFLLIQRWVQRRQEARERRLGIREDSGVLVRRGDNSPSAQGLDGRIDSGFDRLVGQTGLPIDSGSLLALMMLLAVAIGGGLYVWRDDIGLATLGFSLGLAIPFAIIWLLRDRYRQQVQGQLADAIYLLARSLRAGLSLPQAIELVAEEGPKPVADEFARCAASLRLRLSPAVSVEMMADRLQLLDVNALASTVRFYQTTGGNLPLLLDRLAAGARDRNQFRGQFFAATAQGRITATALAAAAPLLVLGYLLFQPDHVQGFLQSPRGWGVLIGAAVLEVIGMLWVYRILKIDY